jgi:alkylation response protein AidB-like acyl-CoA dehydrogenase
MSVPARRPVGSADSADPADRVDLTNLANLVGAVRAVVRESADATDRDAEFPVATLAALRRTGLLGLLVPAEYGGLGGSVRDMVWVSTELARDCTSAGMIFAMHCQQVAALTSYASPALRQELLPRIARGEVYLASVTTEAGKGGHLLSAEQALADRGDGLRIDRTAPIVTGGAHADGFLITMQAPAAASAGEVSLVYADRAQLHTEVVGGWDTLGMRATESVPMRLTGAVPADQVVGRHGGFADIAMQSFAPLAHLGWSACWLGTASGALARTVTMLRSREERGRRDLTSELFLSRLSRTRQRLDLTNAVIQHALDTFLSGVDPTTPRQQLLLNTVKLTASEQCLAAVDELVELVGLRHGYQRQSPLRLERALRDLRAAPLNYANDRLHFADGRLVLLDPEVRLA